MRYIGVGGTYDVFTGRQTRPKNMAEHRGWSGCIVCFLQPKRLYPRQMRLLLPSLALYFGDLLNSPF